MWMGKSNDSLVVSESTYFLPFQNATMERGHEGEVGAGGRGIPVNEELLAGHGLFLSSTGKAGELCREKGRRDNQNKLRSKQGYIEQAHTAAGYTQKCSGVPTCC